ncbi:MAG: hypothetical protein PWR32_575 [Candidatus Woesearchaeota archaeon]|nr:hypothetical protein [Candidatus Woesearchaeota archaeon]
MKFLKAEDLKNRDEMADFGLHKRVIDEIKSLSLNPDAEILIVGAGKGNLDRLLIKENFRNITSVDINKENYKISGTTFYQFDLNNDWNFDNKKYDLILAVEIIEHIYSTEHFIQQIKRKLKKNGIAIITTPNVLEKNSRLAFCILGRLSYFNDKDITRTGHINPIFPHILKWHLKKNQLKIIKETYNRKYFDLLIVDTWKSFPYFLLKWLITTLLKLIALKKKILKESSIYMLFRNPNEKIKV